LETAPFHPGRSVFQRAEVLFIPVFPLDVIVFLRSVVPSFTIVLDHLPMENAMDSKVFCHFVSEGTTPHFN
jgi:hypothetical protein